MTDSADLVTRLRARTVADLNEIAERISALSGENERLRLALTFYADQRRYQGANADPIPDDAYSPPDFVYRWDVTRDHGNIARAALNTDKGGETP